MSIVITFKILVFFGILYPQVSSFKEDDRILNRVKRFTDTRSIIHRKTRCPKGWLSSPVSCFKFFDDPSNINEAKAKCIYYGHDVFLARMVHPVDLDFMERMSMPMGRVASIYEAKGKHIINGHNKPMEIPSGNIECGVYTKGKINYYRTGCWDKVPYYCSIAKYECPPNFKIYGFFCYYDYNNMEYGGIPSPFYVCPKLNSYPAVPRSAQKHLKEIFGDLKTYFRLNGIYNLCVARWLGNQRMVFSYETVYTGRGCRPFLENDQRSLQLCQSTPVVHHPNCGLGDWVENAVTGLCYFIAQSDETKTTWESAESKCKSMNGTLAIIQDPSDQLFIEILWKGIIFGKPVYHFWIGLKDNKWASDDFPITYTRLSDVSDGCAAIAFVKDYGAWANRNCSDTIGYICQKKGLEYQAFRSEIGGDEDRYDDVISSSVKPAKNMSSCETWLPMLGHCIFITQKKYTFHGARRLCTLMGGYLLEIDSEEKNIAMTETLKKKDSGLIMHFWLGLNSINRYNMFTYEHNKNLRKLFWRNGHPKTAPPAYGKECVWMDLNITSNNNWDNAYCFSKAGAVCQRPEFISKQTKPACPDKKLTDGPYCYELHEEKLDYKSAEATCLSNGGNLVRIESRYTQAVINHITRIFQYPYYIGLIYNKNIEKWVWSNGLLLGLVYRNWNYDKEIDRSSNYTCVVGMGGIKGLGSWRRAPCDENNSFVCQYARPDYYMDWYHQQESPKKCFKGYGKIGYFCYALSLKEKSQEEARKDCSRSGGGYLASFNNETHAYSVASSLGALNKTIWIGLKKNPVSGGIMNSNPFMSYMDSVNSSGVCFCLEYGKTLKICDCHQKLLFMCQNLQENVPESIEVLTICLIVAGSLLVLAFFVIVVYHAVKRYSYL